MSVEEMCPRAASSDMTQETLREKDQYQEAVYKVHKLHTAVEHARDKVKTHLGVAKTVFDFALC